MKLFHFLTHQCPQLLGYCSTVLLDVTIRGTGWRVQEPSLYQCFHESKIPQNKKGRRKKDPCCQWTSTPFSRPVNSSWKATIKGGSPIGLARTQGHPLPTLGTVTEVARPVQEPTMDGSLRRVCRLRGPCLQTDLPRATSDRNKALFHGGPTSKGRLNWGYEEVRTNVGKEPFVSQFTNELPRAGRSTGRWEATFQIHDQRRQG